MGAPLRVLLLGRFEVVRAEAPIPASAWRRRRPADLLKLLALAPGRSLPREAVIDALWPDKDPASGANNLHRALYDLRQVVGGRAVEVDHGTVRLRPEVWVDADEVEQAVRQGGLQRLHDAVALCRGDLSPEDLESPWLVPHRRRLRRRFVEAAWPVARQAADAGDAATAIPLLRRLLAIEPLEEEAHALIMRLLAGTGRRTEALAQYDACVAARRAAGHDRPSYETESLRDRIESGEVGPARVALDADGARRAGRRLLGTDDPGPLRGREALVASLEHLLQRGHGVLVLLGERGVGATRVAVEGARQAQARGCAVLSAAAPGLPCAPGALFAAALADERRARPRDAPDPFQAPPVHHASPEEARLARFEGVRAALEAVAGGGPLYLLLDDLHLADPTSHALLHALAREAEALRLVIVATCREEAVRAGTPIQTALAHLDTERLARGLRVSRLSAAGARAYLGDLMGTTPLEALAGAVHRAADGRPAAIEAVVAAWHHSGLVPADPEAAVRAALAHLPPDGLAFLEAAAVLGRRFPPDLARAAGGLGVRQAIAGLEAAAAAGLLDDTGDGWRFHQAGARDALLLDLPAARRRAIHAAAAEALEEAARRPGAEPMPEAMASHRLQAGQPVRALPHLLAAGHRALDQAALAEGAPLLEDALALADQQAIRLGPARGQALDALGWARLGLAELPALARAAEAAAGPDDDGPAPPGRRARARRWAALARVTGGDLPGALALVEAGLEEADGAGPGASDQARDDAAPLLHLRAQLLWHAGRFEEALGAGLACAAEGDRLDDADLSERGRDMAALAAAMLGRPLPPPDHRRGGQDLRQDRTPDHPLDLHLVLWERDLVSGWAVHDLARATAALSERAAARGARDALAAGRTGAGLAALAAGRLDEAERLLRDALALHREGHAALGEALSLDRLGAVLTATGRHAAAAAALAAGVVAAERGGLRRHALVRLHATLARALLATGELQAAEAALREAAEAMEPHGDCLVCEAALRPELVRAALAGGRIEQAGVEVAALEALAGRHGGGWLGGLAAMARGRLLLAGGHHAEARAALGTARGRWRAAGARLEAARAGRLLARCQGGEPVASEESVLLPCDADA